MTTRTAAVLAFLVALTLSSGGAEARVTYSPSEYLKNFALSVCLADGYTADETHKDSLAAASGYSELGSLPIEAYEEAEALARRFLAKDYKSVSGQPLTLMKCVDLFHSGELDQIARKYSRK
jgi:hypothetical protein